MREVQVIPHPQVVQDQMVTTITHHQLQSLRLLQDNQLQ